MRTIDLLASDSSHLPFLFVFKESGVMEKYGYEMTFTSSAAPKPRR